MNEKNGGGVLDWLSSSNEVTEDELLINQGIMPNDDMLFMMEDEFFLATAREIMRHYNELLISTIRPYYTESIVELGSGLGDKLLAVSSGLGAVGDILGGEFTSAGISCGRLLANKYGSSAQFERFDYNNPDTLSFVPKNSLIYTSHSIEQIPQLLNCFIEGIVKRSPSYVIHFEPCYEDQDRSTLLGLMRNKYTELNDYNRNLVGLLRSYEKNGLVRILAHQKNVFSDTPLNPTSILIWQPV